MTAWRQLSPLIVLALLVACTTDPPEEVASVPSPSISAETSVSYVVRPDRVPVGAHTRAILTNTGTTTIEFGDPYRLERFDRGAWKIVREPPDAKIPCVFTSIGYEMGPGGSKSQRITACHRKDDLEILAPGRYRLIKTFRVSGSEEAEDLSVTAMFRVTPPCGSSEIPEGVNVSERDAIRTAFRNRGIADCSRFETKLDFSDDRKTWNITLLPKGAYGCTQYRGVDAITGERSPSAGEGCP